MTKKKQQHTIDLEQINRHLAAYIEDLQEKNKALQAEVAVLQHNYEDLSIKYQDLMDARFE